MRSVSAGCALGECFRGAKIQLFLDVAKFFFRMACVARGGTGRPRSVAGWVGSGGKGPARAAARGLRMCGGGSGRARGRGRAEGGAGGGRPVCGGYCIGVIFSML